MRCKACNAVIPVRYRAVAELGTVELEELCQPCLKWVVVSLYNLDPESATVEAEHHEGDDSEVGV